MNPERRTQELVAEAGDSIYERDVRPILGSEHAGKVVAIDIDTGMYAIDQDALKASARIRDERPDAEIWCVRVGRSYLHRIGRGFSSRNVKSC